jgi:hypothetical protein
MIVAPLAFQSTLCRGRRSSQPKGKTMPAEVILTNDRNSKNYAPLNPSDQEVQRRANAGNTLTEIREIIARMADPFTKIKAIAALLSEWADKNKNLSESIDAERGRLVELNDVTITDLLEGTAPGSSRIKTAVDLREQIGPRPRPVATNETPAQVQRRLLRGLRA